MKKNGKNKQNRRNTWEDVPVEAGTLIKKLVGEHWLEKVGTGKLESWMFNVVYFRFCFESYNFRIFRS